MQNAKVIGELRAIAKLCEEVVKRVDIALAMLDEPVLEVRCGGHLCRVPVEKPGDWCNSCYEGSR